MSKHKTKEEWIKLFKKYEKESWNWSEYYKNEVVFSTRQSRGSGRNRTQIYKRQRARVRFRKKYKTWKLLDNAFMKSKI